MKNKSHAKLKVKSENKIEKWDTKMKSKSQVELEARYKW